MFTVGIDEAGYGTIAGPMIVAAVVYPEMDPPHIENNGRVMRIQDSKNVKADCLMPLSDHIKDTAHSYMTHVIPPFTIDKVGGPYEAKMIALRLVALRIVEQLHVFGSEEREARVIIDGHVELDLPFPYEGIPKADSTIWQVSAASILAKREQVMLMEMEHARFPRYMFKNNKGYSTADHLARLIKHGPCRIHRRSTRSLEPWRKKPVGRE